MSARARRGAIADAMLGAGATIILLYSSAQARGGGYALAAGIVLVVAGAFMLWGTPRPSLRTRMLASTAGLLIGFGLALGGTKGTWLSLAAGALLLAVVLRGLRR